MDHPDNKDINGEMLNANYEYNRVDHDTLEDEFCSDENFPEKATTSSDKDVTRCIVKLIVRKMTLTILWKRKVSVCWFGK